LLADEEYVLKFMSEQTVAHLLGLSEEKKLAFLILLYERMIPELQSFCLAEKRDFSIFQKAHEKFIRTLIHRDQSGAWLQLREEIYDATPDMDDFGTLAGSFAMNAALVAANIASFLADGQDEHILEASVINTGNSLSAFVQNEMGTLFTTAESKLLWTHTHLFRRKGRRKRRTLHS